MSTLGAANGQLLARLRAETRAEHDAAEAALDLLRPTLTRSDYRAALVKFHGFYRPVEAVLWADDGWRDRGIEPSERQKLPHLRADLAALGAGDTAGLPVCRDLPPLATAAARFGCLYVLEGATLGGQILGPRLQQQLGLTPDSGARFFDGYGPRTGPLWQEFRAALTAFAVAPDDQEEVIAAALATFQALRRWWGVA